MKLDNNTLAQLAEHLENAELKAHDVTKITDEYPDMDWDDAYAIQDEIKRRKLARGNKIAGLKAGLTSRAKMKQMGVETPVFGFIADYMSVPDGGEVKFDELIHPKVEAEICVVTKAPLRGPGCHIGNVMAAIDFVLPAVEVIDSRYRDFKFDLKSVIADNTSSARFVIGGNMRDLGELDLPTLGVVLEVNGEVKSMAAGAACAARAVRPWPSRSSITAWSTTTATATPCPRLGARRCRPSCRSSDSSIIPISRKVSFVRWASTNARPR